MSILFAEAVETIDSLDPELYTALQSLRTTTPATMIASTTKRWSFRLWHAAVRAKVISGFGLLTPLGIEVVRKINGGWNQPVSAQDVVRSDKLDITTLLTLMLIGSTPKDHPATIAMLSEDQRDILWELGVVDDDWRLTSLGDQVRCDLKWHRHFG